MFQKIVYVNLLFVIIRNSFGQDVISRYGEVSFSENRPRNYGKIEREYRYPRTNFTKFYHVQKLEEPNEKVKDEINFSYGNFETKHPDVDFQTKFSKYDRKSESSAKLDTTKILGDTYEVSKKFDESYRNSERSKNFGSNSETKYNHYDRNFETSNRHNFEHNSENIKIFNDPFTTSEKHFNRNLFDVQRKYDVFDRNFETIPRPNYNRFDKPGINTPIDRKYQTPKKINLDDDINKYDYEKRYVKIPEIDKSVKDQSIYEIVKTPNNMTEEPITENTLDQYQNVPSNTEFVTSKNLRQHPKTFGSFKDGLFTKINTVIRNQITKIFKPKEPFEEEENADRKFGGDTKNFTRFGTVEKIQDKKHKRFLNIFTILQFENSRCQAQGSFLSYEGTCYHRNECAQLRGHSMGACAKGYGVCCVFRGTCGDTTNQNITYFECDNCVGSTQTTTTSPVTSSTQGPAIDPRLNLTALIEMYQGRQSITTPQASPCVYTVQKKDPNVKQIRLDFLDLDIRGPTNGTCLQDQLIISGQNTNNIIPIICGYNTGQHMYVDVSDVPGPIRISVLLMSTTPRRFRIKVSQIRSPCANFMNCLQYYSEVEGTLMSFNYDISPTGLSTPQYFNNLNYAICIRKAPGYCSVTYMNVQNGVEAPFDIRNVDARGTLLIPPNQAGAEIFNCPDDYIIVNGIRLCGGKLNDGMSVEDFTRNAAVTDRSAGPIILPFRTNNNTVGRGFKLYYRQNRCS